MISYKVGDYNFAISYLDLQADYQRFCQMPDEEWKQPETLWSILHLCCVVGYLKEMNGEMLVSDLGIIHEIVHLAQGVSQRSLRDIREQFAKVMALA
jgi:hypothetical protein